MEKRNRSGTKRFINIAQNLVFRVIPLFLLAALITLGINTDSVAFHVNQEETVSGIVTDAETGESLPGVNIIVKGTTIGTTTNIEGEYSLDVPSLNDTLVVSFVGYQTQEIAINGRQSINITLTQSAITGEELVVVGYGTRTKETATGSISAVSGERMEKAPVTNLSQNLSGKIPGLFAVNTSGEPGADDATLRIRGEHTLNNNQPLIVIDGVPSRSGGLDRLNPKNIENITVLKDASAAIYGARAGNGVILVTTKRGNKGAPQFNIEFNQGFSQPTRLPETADASTYLRMLNELNMYRGNPPQYSEEELQNYADSNSDPWLYPNTNWFNEALKSTSHQTKADMSVSGGGENVQYRLSLGALTEDGIFVNSSTRYNQYNFRSNIDGQVSDNIDLKFDVAGRWEDRNYPTVPASSRFENLIQAFPNLPGFWPSGHPGPAFEAGGNNPVVTGSDVTGFDDDDRYYLQTNLQLAVEFPGVDGFEIRTSGSFDKDFHQQKRFVKPWTLYSFDEAAYRANGGDPVQYLSGAKRGASEPSLSQQSNEGYDILVNLIGEYQKDLENHSYNILVGSEYQKFENSWFYAFRRNFITDQVPQFFAGGQAQQDINGSASKGARLNFFSRVNYDYKDKYLLEFVARYDGSYIFPEGNRFGFFPGFSAGWVLSEEEFFQNNLSFLNYFKLRASWGQTGNDRVSPYQHLTSYGFGSGYIFNIDQLAPSIRQTQTPNPNITWEVANQFDVGIEGELFENSLAFEFDYFDYLRTDILTFRNASIPRSSGLELPRENIGEVESWGFDGSLTWRQQINRDFLYDITVSGGYATNEIQFWDEPPGAPEWQKSTGSKMNTGLYYDVIGVFQDQEDIDSYPSWPGARPGDLIFRDVNEDDQINAADRIRVERNDLPEWTGGITLNAEYRQFDLTIFFQGAAGASQYIQTASGQFGNYYKKFADKRWRPDPNDPTAMTPHPDYSNFDGPRAFNRTQEYWIANRNTYFFRETDYLRLKTLEIGYNLPSNISTLVGLDDMRVYANGFNLLTWTSYDLGDPESAGHPRGGRYPQERIFNLGLSVTF
ncbi:SusC/RagA family TonB-linked outer membrane protein [Halalkalibaculum sp. DA3122]|uniref:SusC/RagA family TonB-linked outer membrane protein n=1 Tax=Halalkalibaculum sp. DA3122 TaxID=3373607 RepID=UPI003754D0B0